MFITKFIFVLCHPDSIRPAFPHQVVISVSKRGLPMDLLSEQLKLMYYNSCQVAGC